MPIKRLERTRAAYADDDLTIELSAHRVGATMTFDANWMPIHVATNPLDPYGLNPRSCGVITNIQEPTPDATGYPV